MFLCFNSVSFDGFFDSFSFFSCLGFDLSCGAATSSLKGWNLGKTFLKSSDGILSIAGNWAKEWKLATDS